MDRNILRGLQTGVRGVRHRPTPLLLVVLMLVTLFVTMASYPDAQVFNSGGRSGSSLLTPSVALKRAQPAPEYGGDQQRVARAVSRMTLDEELGQLFMVGYEGTSYSPDLERMIVKLHAGGVILYQGQIKSAAQVKHDLAEMQRHAQVSLFTATDEEGGLVDRLVNIYPPRPSALALYNMGDPLVAAQAGYQVARDLRALGINENFAPDSDVQVVAGPDQLTRTFGYTPQSVVAFAGAYMRTMQKEGVIACVKHFPGLGAAESDAHTGLPIVRRTKAQIYAVELGPFKSFVQSRDSLDHPGMIMSTDVLMPAIDPSLPAELSHLFITDILRKQFGYNGVVITDSLYMQGIAKFWNIQQAAVMALNAGNDMLLGVIGAEQMANTIASLKIALKQGTLSKAHIDEAVTRILTLKMQYHLYHAA
ncbi:MAG: beta-N-acetylhexosaminidase [Ktedonobacteraceae bacterium]